VASVWSGLVAPKRPARALSFSGSYGCNASSRGCVGKYVGLTSASLADLGADFVLGLVDSTRAIPNRAARALRFSNSSSAEVVLGVSHTSGVAVGGGTFDGGLA
jgi:hypothetical protein